MLLHAYICEMILGRLVTSLRGQRHQGSSQNFTLRLTARPAVGQNAHSALVTALQYPMYVLCCLENLSLSRAVGGVLAYYRRRADQQAVGICREWAQMHDEVCF